jgi:vacuolar-type H+-ATPase subunit H
MDMPTPDSEAADASGSATSARLSADAARIRADALASAQRLVETARRSAEEIQEQAARQAEAMVRAARAEVERLTEDAHSRQVAQTVQQVSWDAPARMLEAATAEADLVRSSAETQARALLKEARLHAEREAEQLLQAARARAEEARQEVAARLQQAAQEISQFQVLSSALVERLARANSLVAPDGSAGPDVSAAATGSPRSGVGGSSASSAPVEVNAAPAPLPVTPPEPTPGPGAGAGAVPEPAQAAAPVEPTPAAAPLASAAAETPAPAADASAPTAAGVLDTTPLGEVDLILPERVDRITLEVMVAVLREQPGITVRAVGHRQQTLVIPLLVERPVPLLAILRELPRVAGAAYVPHPGDAGVATGGRVTIVLDDR